MKAAPARKPPASKVSASKSQAGNFGVLDPAGPHFRVDIPRGKSAEVEISDVVPDEQGQLLQELRVRLSRLRWDTLAERVETQLNLRLRQEGAAPGSWRSGLNVLRRDLGKELTLLCWAIEEADPGRIDLALSNWLGLEPEERWWLYTQTAAATGDALTGRGRGWRKAVQYALTDNPVAAERPRQTRRTPGFFQTAASVRAPGLFDDPDS